MLSLVILPALRSNPCYRLPFYPSCYVSVSVWFDEGLMLMKLCTEVQALFAGVVGVSPLQNVLVDCCTEVGFFVCQYGWIV